MTHEKYIEKLINQRKDDYDYSKVKYMGMKQKIEILCNKHGSFWQEAYYHINGGNCPDCALTTRGLKRRDILFIEKARKLQPNYDYSKVNYQGSHVKVTIGCDVHGYFEITPANFIHHGTRCKRCRGITFDKDSFIQKAKVIHDNRYDYSKMNYEDSKVTIICPDHGTFKQRKSEHLTGKGCGRCGAKRAGSTKELTFEQFIKKAKKVHGEKYTYSGYTKSSSNVLITCKKHGEFVQKAANHVNASQGCPKCTHRVSKGEQEIFDYLLNELNITVVQSDRGILEGLELDIVSHDKKIAIEYNGLYYHSERSGKDKHYHISKTQACEQLGYRLVHIWEDEWLYNKGKIKNYLKHLFGVSNEKIYGRKTKIDYINSAQAREFLDKHHMQGFAPATHYVGSFYKGDLVGVTTFVKGKSNTKNRDMYELNRHATSVQVIGALGKVTKFFDRPTYTFCDLCKYVGGSYEKSGYTKVEGIAPDYTYHVGTKREHKFLWRNDNRIALYPETDGMRESEAMEALGLYRIWDCGKSRYEYHP